MVTQDVVIQPNWTSPGRTSPIVFNKLLHYTYGVMVHQDENGNAKLDTNFIGMPQEGVCATREAKGRIGGGPRFRDAKFGFAAKEHEELVNMWYP